MGPIAHFLREDISGVDPPGDVETDSIFSHLHVANLLSCHVIRPPNTCFNVSVEVRGDHRVRDVVTVTTFPDRVRKVTNTH